MQRGLLAFLLAAPAGCSFSTSRPTVSARSRLSASRVSPLGPTMSDGGAAIVTDGTNSFYSSRMIFQTLHDHGEFTKLTAFSSSVAEAKKMLLSRQVRSPLSTS